MKIKIVILVAVVILAFLYYWFIYRNMHVGFIKQISVNGNFIDILIDNNGEKLYTFDFYPNGTWRRNIKYGYVEITNQPNERIVKIFTRAGKEYGSKLY